MLIKNFNQVRGEIMLSRVKKIILVMFLLASGIQITLAQDSYTTKEIKYKTEDGWTISGTLRLPPGADAKNEYSAIILLHEKEHDRSEFVGIGDPGLARKLPEVGIATLNIDLRGRGFSMGEGQPDENERHDFADMTAEQTYMDIKAGMEFLADYPGVDGLRIGIVAMEYSAEHAVRAMQKTKVPTRALVIIGGTDISQESKEYLASIDIPIITGAYMVNRHTFKEMVDIYANSRNPHSYVFTPHPGESDYDASARILNETSSRTEFTINWLVTHVKGLGRNRAITVTTTDGFTIHGNFRYPDDLGKDGKKIPGVVIAPGGRSNRDSYFRFEEDLVRRGIAVVSVEQRGRGQSTMGLSLDDPEIAKLWEEDPADSPYYLDVIAGIDYLVSQEGIDPNNLGLLGGARGSRNAILAAGQDPARIKAMVLMSVYFGDDIGPILPQLDAATLLISTEHRNKDDTVKVHEAMQNSDLLIYPGDAQTHHMQDIEPGIVDDVGKFMVRQLYE
jgi:dienelactone hydrolase